MHQAGKKIPKIPNIETKLKRSKKRYNVPVIGHFADKSVRFRTILEAEKITGINYNLIFEACVGKVKNTRGVAWEYEKGTHYIKYKAQYMNMQEQKEHHGNGH
ncbi:MAG: hypothetical protein GVY19_04765 [Bacteroidetes bacterium]|jgi:hypothetical protein|nr:hypothetical protein [Bacteroidota bacterium]